MNLLIVGISHKTAPVKVRERFSFTRRRLEESLETLKGSAIIKGAVILSTCNRTEIYADIEERAAETQKAAAFIFDTFLTGRAGENDAERYFYILEGADAIRHLFRVASGLESQVVGETQILAQVGSAWETAKESGTTNAFIDEVFEKAQDVGRVVRSKTRISQGNISIGSIAIKMLEESFGRLENKSVLIIGAGKIGALVSKYLKEKNIKTIFVASRTYARALQLSAACGGRAVDFGKLEEELLGVDIVISSTSSPHIVLKKEMLENLMQRRGKRLFIMDLALPRDVAPESRDISGITLYDLDDLKYVMEENHKKRQQEATAAEMIVEEELCLIET